MVLIKRIEEQGRSMIEMLGVLAIVGVLSVGGIAGFNRAMFTYRQMSLMTELAEFIRDVMAYREEWRKLAVSSGASDAGVRIEEQIGMMGILPKNWSYEKFSIYDSSNRCITARVEQTGLVINYPLSNGNKRSKSDVRYTCRLLFERVALPYRDMITLLWIHKYGESGSGSGGRFMGEGYCSSDKNCLSAVTLSDIIEFCETSIVDEHSTFVFRMR
ncbi:MAG: hypothetical protein J6C85_07075 [Alphaproteobacteria bacterium]|nr:hypothetical protein [Alphaproteobacteria bacterium]